MSDKIKVITFKDQPNGKCHECKWNDSPNDRIDCICPQVHLSNPICIQKIIMVFNLNSAYYLGKGEE